MDDLNNQNNIPEPNQPTQAENDLKTQQVAPTQSIQENTDEIDAKDFVREIELNQLNNSNTAKEQPTTTNQPTQVNQNPANTQPRKHKGKLILISILIFIILGAGSYGGYIAYKKYPKSIALQSVKSKIEKTTTKKEISKDSKTASQTEEAKAKDGWQTIIGCVQPYSAKTDINYELYLPNNYKVVDEDSGCKKKIYDGISYMPAESNNTGSTNFASIDVAISQTKTGAENELPDSTAYFQVPSPNDKYYILLHRAKTQAIENTNLWGVSDDDWAYIKQSFKFQ